MVGILEKASSALNLFKRRRSDTKVRRSNEDKSKAPHSTWRIVPDARTLESKLASEIGHDIQPGLVELRTVLEDPQGQTSLGQFAKQRQTHEAFFAWTEIQEFRAIPTADYRRGMAMHIYQKYVKDGAVQQVGGLSPHDRNAIYAVLQSAKSSRSSAARESSGNDTTTAAAAAAAAAALDEDSISAHLFDKVQSTVLSDMYFNTFVPFKATPQYEQLRTSMRNAYNKVCLEDFDYIARLGEGGFGRVLHVVKRSTGAHLAMKVQLKSGLIDTFSDDLSRIDHER
jgi:Regulator of G protein signaling domain